jgi:hypothetical protein
MPFDYLAGLNPEQRRAVEYGVKPGSVIRSGLGATFHDSEIVNSECSYLEDTRMTGSGGLEQRKAG